ncbi:hypothetical protein ACIQM0_03475 [Streptomyces sp. NPDC091387]
MPRAQGASTDLLRRGPPRLDEVAQGGVDVPGLHLDSGAVDEEPGAP